MALMPGAGINVTPGLVRDLLRAQRPDLAALPLSRVANGWDNVIFRLGGSYAVRVPRREEAVDLIIKEQLQLAGYALRSPVPIPAPVFDGRPYGDYPWPWSIVQWVSGEQACAVPAGLRSHAAGGLAAFLKGIHVPAGADAPVNPVRGVPLEHRKAAVLDRLTDRRRYPESQRLRHVWADALAAPPWRGTAVWLHGDLHAANILLDEGGHLAGVIDFGDLGAGDPAVDYAAAWLVFNVDGRRRFIAASGSDVDADTWRRARGWALVIATAMVSNSDDNPVMRASGHFAVEQLLRR